jgi:hypothetical protein
VNSETLSQQVSVATDFYTPPAVSEMYRKLPTNTSWWKEFSKTATYNDIITLYESGNAHYCAARSWSLNERKGVVDPTQWSNLCKMYSVIKYGRRLGTVFDGKARMDELKSHLLTKTIKNLNLGSDWFAIAETFVN